MAARPSDRISGTVFGCYPVQGHTTNHARGASLLARHTRHFQGHAECFSVFPRSCSTTIPCISQTRSLNLSTNPVQLSSHHDVAKSSSVADTSGTAVLNTQKLRQVVRMSRDVTVHVNVSFTRNGSAEKQLSSKIPEVTQVLGKVALPIQDLWSCSPSPSYAAISVRNKLFVLHHKPWINDDFSARDVFQSPTLITSPSVPRVVWSDVKPDARQDLWSCSSTSSRTQQIPGKTNALSTTNIRFASNKRGEVTRHWNK